MDDITTLMSVAFIFEFNCTLMAVRQTKKVIFKSQGKCYFKNKEKHGKTYLYKIINRKFSNLGTCWDSRIS